MARCHHRSSTKPKVLNSCCAPKTPKLQAGSLASSIILQIAVSESPPFSRSENVDEPLFHVFKRVKPPQDTTQHTQTTTTTTPRM
mmetsp:Transcript_35888/g.58015  ORF Transcript_35888/g.58015 Transcript_35888/m.58015 type:complete len:85 (-) Transcript_35888:31-285(-)